MSIHRLFANRLRSIIVTVLLASSMIAAFLGSYTLGITQPKTSDIPVTFEEPIVIIDYPKSLNLFPGENRTFDVTIRNQAPVEYQVTLVFTLNDTEYQKDYVTFSDQLYTLSINSTTALSAWLSVSSSAPAANLLLTVACTRTSAEPTPQQTQTPIPSENSTETVQNSTLPPSVTLFGAGALWTAPNGTRALLISNRDCFGAHGLTDGKDWGPWDTVETMDIWKAEITQVLQQGGFDVSYAGDMPPSLDGYDLVVIEAYWGLEPEDSQLIRSFVGNGGGVAMVCVTPCMLSVYCKDRWPYRFGGTDLTSLSDWFGYQDYVNVGGSAHMSTDNLLGTSLKQSDYLFYTSGSSAAAVMNPVGNVTVIARYDSGFPLPMEMPVPTGFSPPQNSAVFAFTREFGAGRVYWQGHIWPF